MEDIKKINLSIAPTYKCNMHCSFCYLTKRQRTSEECLNLSLLNERIKELEGSGYEIEHVDVYGGEISLLSEDYLNELFDMLLTHSSSVNAVTNLLQPNMALWRLDIDLSVSFDWHARPHAEDVLMNIRTIPRDVSILSLATDELMNKPIKDIVDILNWCSNIKSFEIKPYSRNQNNDLENTDGEYEKVIQNLIEHPLKRFDFVNEEHIQLCLDKEYNSFSNNHIYVTPESQFAVLDFDENDKEFFKTIDLSDYEEWCAAERRRVESTEPCKNCEFKGHCLTEHYRRYTCSGFPELLKL